MRRLRKREVKQRVYLLKDTQKVELAFWFHVKVAELGGLRSVGHARDPLFPVNSSEPLARLALVHWVWGPVPPKAYFPVSSAGEGD